MCINVLQFAHFSVLLYVQMLVDINEIIILLKFSAEAGTSKQIIFLIFFEL